MRGRAAAYAVPLGTCTLNLEELVFYSRETPFPHLVHSGAHVAFAKLFKQMA